MRVPARFAATLVLLLPVLACATAPPRELTPDELARRLVSAPAEQRPEVAQEAWKAGPEAVDALVPLLSSEDPAVAKNARLALDNVVHHAAARGRERERRAVSERLRAALEQAPAPAVATGLLHLLGASADDGRSVAAVAARLRDPALADAALFALARIRHEAAERALIEALDAGDLALARADVARALGARRSAAAAKALLAFARGASAADARVAREALARLGDARAEPLLVKAWEDGLQRSTTHLLLYVDARLAAGEGEGEGEELTALCGRLLDRATKPHQRAAAVRLLARAAGPGALERLVVVLGDPAADVRSAAREALVELRGAQVQRDLARSFEETADPALRGELLRVLVARGDTSAGRLVREAIEAGDGSLRLTGLELAGALESPALEAALLRYADGGEPEEQATARASLLGYARAHRLRGDGERALAIYHALLDETARRALLTEALAGVAAIASPASLERLRPLQERRELRDAVDAARVAIAASLLDADRDAALAELTAVAVGEAGRAVRAQAAAALEELGVSSADLARQRGFANRWYLAGPYELGSEEDFATHPFGADGPRLPFGDPAEVPVEGDPERSWRLVVSQDVDGAVDLLPQFAAHDNVCAYAAAQVRSGGAAEVVLKLGSDDGVAVWLNGELVHANWTWRGLSLDQDEVPLRLREGENHLLLKISQGGGDWGFCARLCDAEGRPVELPPR